MSSLIKEGEGVIDKLAQPIDEKLRLEREKLDLEQEKAAHARWWQEDALVNQRLTWLIQSQVILFAGYGYLVRENINSSPTPEAGVLAEAFPWIGIAVSVLIALGIRAAWLAQKILVKDYAAKRICVGVSNITTRTGRIPAGFLPFVFIGSWGWLLNPQIRSWGWSLKPRTGMLACLASAFVIICITEKGIKAWEYVLKMFAKWRARTFPAKPIEVGLGKA
jgi:hypothetical protein